MLSPPLFVGFALHGRLTIFAVNPLHPASEIIEMLSEAMTAELDGGFSKPQGVHRRNYDACDRQLSRNVVATCAEYLAHHRRPAVPGAWDVEIFKLASFALDGSGPHVALRHQRND